MTGILPVDIKMLVRSRLVGIESKLVIEISEDVLLDTVAWGITAKLEPEDLLVVDPETEAELAFLELICTAEELNAISLEGRVPETEGSDVVARLEEEIC